MISEILINIMAYILFTSFGFCVFVGSIFLIIIGVQGLEEEDWSYLLIIILGSIGIIMTVIFILKVFGL